MLEKVDLQKKVTQEEYKQALAKAQIQLRELQLALYRRQVPLLCVFEGWDAAGKGGVIQRLTEHLDPRGFTVSAFASPRGEEKTHHYLWRFWKAIPRAGHIGVWDRSHYGRVLVERIEGFCADNEWRRAYREINEFEMQQTSFGMVICKFWFQISKEEQLRRFKKRELDPYRAYKLTEEDWRNRAKWKNYQAAADEMLLHTSTAYAPWTVVEAEDKYFARVKTVRKVVETLRERLA